MATSPPSKLLDRDFSKAEAREQIDAAVPLLEEVVNYGLAVFARCSVRPDGRDENAAILLPFHHLLEMIDGVQVLVAAAAPIPARLPLRSAFEALLAIEYITQADTVRRAYAYLVGTSTSAWPSTALSTRPPQITSIGRFGTTGTEASRDRPLFRT